MPIKRRPLRRADPAYPPEKRQATVDIVARVMLLCVIVFIVLAAHTSETSLPYAMSQKIGITGKLPLLLLEIAALLLAADLVINDAPHRWFVPAIATNRHWIYFWAGWACLMPAFTAATEGMHKPAATWLYITMAASAMLLALRHVLAVRRGHLPCAH